MSRPSFQFYPGDWRKNANLGRCSKAARGAWIDVLCVLHDSDEYGVARYPLKELANASSCSVALLRELVAKGVLKGAEGGSQVDAYVYVPRTGRKDGDPVTLIAAQPGPLWYSSRMVKDEHVRHARGEGTRFGDERGPSPKAAPRSVPKRAPKAPFGDGPSSSSSSSIEEIPNPPGSPSSAAPTGLSRFPPGFEAFWAAYPRKVGKDAAIKAFARRKFTPSQRQEVLEAIARQRTWEQWTREAGQFIPHPATWLNEGRWQDEPPQGVAVSSDRYAGSTI